MVDFGGADAVKLFPALQLAAGAMVVIVGVFLTLRAAKDNKKDAHIAPQGHDPYGLVVMMNSALMHLGIVAENTRRMSARLDDMHDENIKTNSRLAEMSESHRREMDSLRDTVERAKRPR